MRELTIRIKFTCVCLGNVRDRQHNDGRFILLRTPDGRLMFPATWHHSNMKQAAQLLGRHQDEVGRILWDVMVDARLRSDPWYRRYPTGTADCARARFVLHEALFPGQVVGINCAVPAAISDNDMVALMNLAGRYKGLSPWKPGEFGHYEVESIRPRRPMVEAAASETQRQPQPVK